MPGCGENSGTPPSSENKVPVNDNIDVPPGLNLHIVNGGVHLPDNLVNVNQ